MIWLFTFNTAIATEFRLGGNSYAFTSSWFSVVSFVIFWSYTDPMNTSAEQLIPDMIYQLVGWML